MAGGEEVPSLAALLRHAKKLQKTLGQSGAGAADRSAAVLVDVADVIKKTTAQRLAGSAEKPGESDKALDQVIRQVSKALSKNDVIAAAEKRQPGAVAGAAVALAMTKRPAPDNLTQALHAIAPQVLVMVEDFKFQLLDLTDAPAEEVAYDAADTLVEAMLLLARALRGNASANAIKALKKDSATLARLLDSAKAISGDLSERLAALPADEDPEKSVFDRIPIEPAVGVARCLVEALSGVLHATAAMPPQEWTLSERSSLLQVLTDVTRRMGSAHALWHYWVAILADAAPQLIINSGLAKQPEAEVADLNQAATAFLESMVESAAQDPAESGRLAKLEAGARLLAAILGNDGAAGNKSSSATPQQRASFAKLQKVASNFLADVELPEYQQPMYQEAAVPWEPKRPGSTMGNLNDAAAAAAGALADAVAGDLTAAGSNGKAARADDAKAAALEEELKALHVYIRFWPENHLRGPNTSTGHLGAGAHAAARTLLASAVLPGVKPAEGGVSSAPADQVVLGVNSALAVLAMATKVTGLPTADTKKDDSRVKRPDYVTEACKALVPLAGRVGSFKGDDAAASEQELADDFVKIMPFPSGAVELCIMTEERVKSKLPYLAPLEDLCTVTASLARIPGVAAALAPRARGEWGAATTHALKIVPEKHKGRAMKALQAVSDALAKTQVSREVAAAEEQTAKERGDAPAPASRGASVAPSVACSAVSDQTEEGAVPKSKASKKRSKKARKEAAEAAAKAKAGDGEASAAGSAGALPPATEPTADEPPAAEPPAEPEAPPTAELEALSTAEPEPKEAAADEPAVPPGAPDWVLCPLTKSVMKDPVVMQDGNTYERAAILVWLDEHGTSPTTGEPLSKDNPVPNHSLRSIISSMFPGIAAKG